MYRSDEDAMRARYRAAARSIDASWSNIEDARTRIAQLNQQLRDQELPTVSVVDVTGPALPESPERDWSSAAGIAESEAERLAHRADELETLIGHMREQIDGDRPTPLCEPPRAVPLRYIVDELAREIPMSALGAVVFLGGGMAISPLDPTMWIGYVGCFGAWIVFAAASLFALRRRDFLAQCMVATSAEVLDSRPSGTVYSFYPMRRSSGWRIEVETFDGPGRSDTVRFHTPDGRTGELVVKGSGYNGGVVLYDPQTLQAKDVKDVSSAPMPRADGHWSGVQRLWTQRWTVRLYVVLLIAACVVTVFNVARLPG